MVSRMRWAGLLLASLFAPPVAGYADDRAVEGDLKKMQGRWTTDSFAGTATTFTFNGHQLEVESVEAQYTISVTLDQAAKPEKTIDLKTEKSTTLKAEGVTSPGIYRFEGDDRLLICFRARGERPTKYETVGFEQWRIDLRRQPAEAAKIAETKVEPAAADSDAPLPKDWPDASAPGVVEVKQYPAYRSAIVREDGARAMDQGRMFFPLFNHITRNHIAMTAPVVMTYAPQVIERAGAKGEVSMEFLYARPDQGEVGPGVGKVKVEDRPAGTFVCLGVQGKMDEARLREGVARLRGWLLEHRDKWTEAGPPRELGYHGPMTPTKRRLWEVQIPIKPVAEGDAGARVEGRKPS